MRRARARGRGRCELAWNPEFLREGYAVEDTLRPDRLVIGVQDEQSEADLREVYAPLIDTGIPMLVTDYATAELVKVAANAFLATKISFINAMAEVCEAAGADVMQLAEALALRPAHRRPVPRRRASASAAAACPRTSARSWPAPASSARTRR